MNYTLPSCGDFPRREPDENDIITYVGDITKDFRVTIHGVSQVITLNSGDKVTIKNGEIHIERASKSIG